MSEWVSEWVEAANQRQQNKRAANELVNKWMSSWYGCDMLCRMGWIQLELSLHEDDAHNFTKFQKQLIEKKTRDLFTKYKMILREINQSESFAFA